MGSTPVAGNDWFLQISMIRRQLEALFENAYEDITIFNAPEGQLAQLPDALGGDPKRWRDLETAAAHSTLSFFELLQAKAQFLMLPKAIVRRLDPLRVNLSEEPILDDPKARGRTIWNDSARTAEVRIPGASGGLARTGYVFGRKVFPVPAAEDFDGLDTIYHEFTHAWFDLRELSPPDSEVQTLWASGVLAYLSASGVSGTDFSDQPGKAFSEAAAYYVGDRISRWLTALDEVNFLWSLKPSDGDSATLQAIQDSYDKPPDTYGIVNHEAIASPQLPPALRDAINEKVLDGLPLTKPFDDTPLASLRDAIRNR